LDKTNIKNLQAVKNQIVLFQRKFLICVLLCTPFLGFSQTNDSITLKQDTIGLIDSLGNDSLVFSILNHKSSLEIPVEYEALDSIVLDMKSKKARLYGSAVVVYEDITLKADYIEVNFESKDVFARGVISDSSGKYIGRPEFADAGKVYEADTISYSAEVEFVVISS